MKNNILRENDKERIVNNFIRDWREMRERHAKERKQLKARFMLLMVGEYGE